MPLETTLAIIATIAAFGGYALALAWAVWYTRKDLKSVTPPR